MLRRKVTTIVKKLNGVVQHYTINIKDTTSMVGSTRSRQSKPLVDKLLERATSHPSFEPNIEYLQQVTSVLQQADTISKMSNVLPLCQIVEQATTIHVVAATECIRIYATVGQYQSAIDLASKVLKQNYFFSNTALCCALDAASALGQVDQGLELFYLSVQRGTHPNRNVYGHLLALCASQGDSPSSLRIQTILSHMIDSNCSMDGTILYHWMLSYARHKSYSHVIQLFDTMEKQYQIVPDEKIYTIRMDTSAEQGDYPTTIKLLETLQPDQRQVSHYNIALKACGKASALTHAFHLYEEMKDKKIQPNLITYITMMHAVYHGELGHIDPNKVKYTLTGIGTMGCAFLPFINYQQHLMTVLFCTSLIGSMGLAMYINPHSVQRALYPDTYTDKEENIIEAFFRRLREEDHCGRSMYLWREMLKHGIQADTHVYDVLARTCIKKRHPELAYEAVFEQQLPLIDERTGSFILPQATVVSFLHALLSQQRYEMVNTVFDAARTHHVFSNLFHEKGDHYTYILWPFTTVHVRSYVLQRILKQWHQESHFLKRSIPRIDFLVIHGYDLLDQLDHEDAQIRALFSMDEMVKVNGHKCPIDIPSPPFYYRLSISKKQFEKFLNTPLIVKEKL